MEAEIAEMCLQAKDTHGCWQPSEAGSDMKWLLLESLRKEPTLPIPSLRSWERMHVCSHKPPSLW